MKTEPKIGERVAWNNVRYRCYEAVKLSCVWCDLFDDNCCHLVECRKKYRKDGKDVFFIREGHYSRMELSNILKDGRLL